MDKSNIIIKCLEVKQPIGFFYVATIDWQDLLKICYSDIRRIEREENSEVETYFGIQRELEPKRIKSIAQYVENIDATFPSSIILAIDSITKFSNEKELVNISFDRSTSELKIRKDENIAKIIDGQHRVYGLKKGLENNLFFQNKGEFQLVVSIFVDMDIDDQSMVFATINKAQTKVNKSLVYDLYEYSKTHSPQRTAHNIVRLLNERKGSPFVDKIKILGRADDPERETITQSTFVECILKYISREPEKDRDILKRGKSLDPLYPSDKDFYHLFLRNYFINKEDAKIALFIWNYFKAVENKWPKSWSLEYPAILPKSTGLISLMRLLKDVYRVIEKDSDVPTFENFKNVFEKIDINDMNFTKEQYPPGGVGESKLYKELKSFL